MMRRGYTIAQYRNLIAEIREKIPGVALSNDVIVGFPSETEEQFQETVQLLTDLRFDTVHIAAYSSRPGTIAARDYDDDIPAIEKKRRLQILEKLQESIAAEINASLMGKSVEVLVEGKQKEKWYGRTRTDKIVFFSDSNNWSGKLAILDIERTSPWSLQGRLRQ
jgi:tRNA-2-methylthio-N6-dimethylallyladenosine synthase